MVHSLLEAGLEKKLASKLIGFIEFLPLQLHAHGPHFHVDYQLAASQVPEIQQCLVMWSSHNLAAYFFKASKGVSHFRM